MTFQEHKKHSDLARPSYGNFGRNEWSLLGTHCGAIKALAGGIIKRLSQHYKFAYVDAKHAGEGPEEGLPGRLDSGALLEYTQHANYHNIDCAAAPGSFGFRQLFSDADITLVNGNHFEANAQVIFIDPAREASLKKRMSQVNNLQMIILTDEATTVFDFVREAHPGWESLPICRLTEMDSIAGFFEKAMVTRAPKLKGLVLAGGKSVRMGFDKGKIDWFGKEQRYHLADIISSFCEEVFISCRSGQEAAIDSRYNTLVDTFTGLGPMGAILSAFRMDPDAAWLVTACDMPLLDANVFRYLCKNRSLRPMATCFESPFDGMPEPLITIWEPKSYPVMLSFLAQGYSCPRKVLMNNQIRLLKPPDADAVTNVNTVEEAERVRDILGRRRIP